MLNIRLLEEVGEELPHLQAERKQGEQQEKGQKEIEREMERTGPVTGTF